jgi:hypothetical protein
MDKIFTTPLLKVKNNTVLARIQGEQFIVFLGKKGRHILGSLRIHLKKNIIIMSNSIDICDDTYN